MFSEAKARRVTQFIECLRHTKGEFHGQPFKLLPWQETVIRDVFGTVRDDDTPYLRTKRELLAATRADALRLAGRVRVNAVAPGPVLPPESCHERAGATPLGRHPAPSEVADAVAYLLSAESTTGAVIPVDGGQSLLSEP